MEKDITLRIAKLVDLYDNVNTPDLDQTPDSILRPGETLEDFDVRFRRPNADGGRSGFAEGDIVTTSNLKELLKKYGVVLNDSNFSRTIKELGVKSNEVKGKNTTWIEPSEEEFNNIAEENKIRRAKNVRYTKEGIEAFEKRKSKVADIIQKAKGNITLKRIRDQLEGALLSKDEIKKIAEDLGYTLPSGREKGNIDVKNINARTKKLIEDLNVLKNDKILNDIINKPDFDIAEDILELKKRATQILPDNSNPVRRVAELLMGYSGDDPDFTRYVGEVSDDLKMAAENISSGYRTGQFGGLQGSLTRLAAEKEASIGIGKDSGFFASQRKRLGELIQNILGKKGTVSIDEIKAIAGNRAKTPIYNLFVQGIKQTINEDKMKKLDRVTANAEIALQKAKTPAEKIKIKDDYNAKVQKFVDEANKNLKPGELPIRAFKISLEKPENTIKNKQGYSAYKSYFDDVYTKHGYSFEVPEDVMTSEQAKKFLNTDAGKKILKDRYTKFGGKAGRLLNLFLAPTGAAISNYLYGKTKPKEYELTASASDTPIVEQGLSTAEKIGAGTTGALALGTKTGRNILGRVVGAGFGPTGLIGLTLGTGGYDLTNPIDRLSLGAEAAFAPELVKGTIGATKGMKNRAVQKGIQRVLNLGLKTPTALRFARVASPIGIASLGLEGAYQYGKFVKDELDRIKQMTPEEREAYNIEQQEQMGVSAAEGGLIGDKSGPPPESGPMSQGLQGLMKRGMKG